MPGLSPHWPASFPTSDIQIDDVAGRQAETPRGRGAERHKIIPGNFREWLGQLLQPRVIGPTTVADCGVGPEDNLDGLLIVRRHVRQFAVVKDQLGGKSGKSGSGHYPIVQSFFPQIPELLRGRLRVLTSPVIADESVVGFSDVVGKQSE